MAQFWPSFGQPVRQLVVEGSPHVCDAGWVTIWPRVGATGSQLLDGLVLVHTKAVNILAEGGHTPAGIIGSYLDWGTYAERLLRPCMRAEDIRRYVLTDRYWATFANPADSSTTLKAVNEEISARQAAFEELVAAVRAQLAAWSMTPAAETATVVPDTNVLLEHPESLGELDWHALLGATVTAMANVRVVIPLLVIDELDEAKRDRSRSRARQTLKLIYDYFGDQVERSRLHQPAQELKGSVEVKLLLDPPGHVRLPRPDDELVDRGAALQSFLGSPVEFATYDTGAALRARAAGLRPHRLQRNLTA